MNNEIFYNEDEARKYLEGLRWPEGTTCPKCGGIGAYKLVSKEGSKKGVRPGVWKCKHCRKQFTVKVGTIFEDSHIPLHKWLHALSLFASSKKGISTHQIHRMLKITYKSAWFMTHRIRYAMKEGGLAPLLKGNVEVDETYLGGKRRGSKRGRGAEHKTPIVALIQRDGKIKTRIVKRVDAKTLKKAIIDSVDKESTIYTDEWRSYTGIGQNFEGGHKVVNHGMGQYVNGDAYTNTAESYFALLKRGVNGIFHHVSKNHLSRYCDEFEFRWNNRKVTDEERFISAINLTEGKRLYYKNA